jgi:hypothetical protein
MAGAFTAATDDASAVAWNPAALASGSYFSLLADVNLLHAPNDASRPSATLVAIGTPPLGLSYRRTVTLTSTGTSPTATSTNGRNTAGEVQNDRIVAHHVGVTLVHSLASGLAVGATLKVVHFGLRAAGSSAEQAASTTFDADVGVMKAGEAGRLGVTVSNVRQPALVSAMGDEGVRLDRRVRAGAALNLTRATLVAVDVDLNRTHGPLGLGRDVAVGVEHQPFTRAWIRGGVSWRGLARQSGAAAAAAGASYAVYGKTQVDAQVTWSSKEVDRSWGVGIRWVF